MSARALVAACVIMAACMPGLAAAQQRQPSLYAAIKSYPNLSYMANFVAGPTAEALKNPKLAAYTIFAPTNDAFQRMLNIRIPGVDVRSFMNNRAIVTMVMNNHIVSGAWPTNKMYNGQKLQTRTAGSAGVLTIVKSGNDIQVQSVGATAKITKANILGGNNGVLQIIDSMLLPLRIPTSGH